MSSVLLQVGDRSRGQDLADSVLGAGAKSVLLRMTTMNEHARKLRGLEVPKFKQRRGRADASDGDHEKYCLEYSRVWLNSLGSSIPDPARAPLRAMWEAG